MTVMRVSFGLFAAFIVAAPLLMGACTPESAAPPPAIPFADITDNTLKDPDNALRTFRIDFARVEREAPLSRADLAKITSENIAALSQEQVDQIYGRLTAGPVPDGPYQGNLFFARGDSLDTRLGEVLGGVQGRIATAKIATLETVGKTLWKGKMFDRNQHVLRNFIDDLTPLRPLIDDPASVPTVTIKRQGWLGSILPANKVWLLFPAKLYCGQSLVDSRRESVIIDYSYGDEVAGWRASPDSLAGRGGLRIRDEIRMVRPGFYIGRAYANRLFLLNFTLYNAEVSETGAAAFAQGKPISEDCWTGEQARSETANR
jgi:hypothetical protein